MFLFFQMFIFFSAELVILWELRFVKCLLYRACHFAGTNRNPLFFSRLRLLFFFVEAPTPFSSSLFVSGAS
jgi:hypothetical protein